MDSDGFLDFAEMRRDDLERLARYRRDGSSGADLLGELWEAAVDVAARLGTPLRLESSAHQAAVLQQLRRRHACGQRPWMQSLDQPLGHDDDGSSLYDLLGDDAPDPVHALLLQEARAEAANAPVIPPEVAGTYSQAAAYLILFERADGSLASVAGLLRVGIRTLRRRLARLIDLHRVQLRLFDGVCRIDPASIPPLHS